MKQTSLLAFIPALLSLAGAAAAQGLTESSLETHVDAVTLSASFNPIKEAYWTGYKHHRRTPFSVSPDGKTAYLAFLDSSETGVHVQPIDPSTFKATGTVVTVDGGKEAGGLVAQDDGFALLTNEAMPSGTSNAPADSTPVPVLYRFDASGTQKWKTWLGGPEVTSDMGLMAAPDMNGDLVYSAKTGRYAAYTVVTAYSGSAQGHFGDAINYVEDSTGERVTIQGATSAWGCSHNTGIALEAADEAPYASVCAEDQGAIWLNSKGQGMSTVGTKISNENVTNGGGGESLGGMSGSYSNLARFQDSEAYIFAWVSRGAKDVTINDWMGDGYTHVTNRTNGRNVAIATFSDKYTMNGQQATSEIGAASGDSQVNWLTTGTADQSNAHVATFDSTTALVTWEEIADPFCEFIAMGCRGKFTGSKFQLVSNDGTGKAVGEPLTSMDVTVAGDLVTMADGRICWPYVAMDWDLSSAVGYGGSTTTTTKMSFACMSNGSGSGSSTGGSASASSAAPTSAAASSSAAPAVPTSSSAAAVTSSAAATTAAIPTNVAAADSDETPVESPVPTSSAAAQTGEEAPVAEAPAAEETPASSTQASKPRPTRRPCSKKRRAALLAARNA